MQPAPPPVVAPARPADPNKAFVPPPGWTPPGQPAAPVVASAATPPPSAPAVTTAAAAAPAGGETQVAVIQFGRMSSELTAPDYAVLERVAQIQRASRAQVRVVAHASEDANGSSAAQLASGNFEVSRQRALAVANQLVRLGVPANRIVAEAASDEEPAYQTTSARGIAANRRAEIFVDF